jgi:hypothetical protein
MVTIQDHPYHPGYLDTWTPPALRYPEAGHAPRMVAAESRL